MFRDLTLSSNNSLEQLTLSVQVGGKTCSIILSHHIYALLSYIAMFFHAQYVSLGQNTLGECTVLYSHFKSSLSQLNYIDRGVPGVYTIL